MPETTIAFDQWAIVEVMGHKKYAGHVTEQVIGGQSFIRVDVPETKNGERTINAFTKLIGGGSIYMITPTDEDVARRSAQALAYYTEIIPVQLPPERQLAATSEADVVDDDDNDGSIYDDHGRM